MNFLFTVLRDLAGLISLTAAGCVVIALASLAGGA